MLAEEFVVHDADSPLWQAAKPLFEIAWKLEQGDDNYRWHGWRKDRVDAFLANLPRHCSLMVGVWRSEELPSIDATAQTNDTLVLGFICEIERTEVRSVRTFTSLADPRLPAVQELEPGYQHALELMRVAREQVAPVAWALFTDDGTWNEWITTESDPDVADGAIDKGKLLTLFAQQGRCVLLGSQTIHHRERG